MNKYSIPVENERIQRHHFALLALIFVLSISSLLLVYIRFPEVDPYVDE